MLYTHIVSTSFPLPNAINIHGPCSPSYGVWISCVGGYNPSPFGRVEPKAFRRVNSLLFTDFFSFKFLRSVISILIFYICFMLNLLVNFLTVCAHPPYSTIISALSAQDVVQVPLTIVKQRFHIFIFFAGKL